MAHNKFHEFDHQGKHYTVVYDEDFDFADIDAEILKNLDSGVYVVLGCIVTARCPGVLPAGGQALHCDCCKEHDSTVTTDSLWGIVIEPDIAKVEAFVKESM
jgi:hypothetical protein